MHSSRKIIYSALGANVLIAVTKFVAGGVSHSSAMIAEGIHSLIDTINEFLLLLGMKRSKKPADDLHPLGYGRELYFWSFMVSVLIFGLGGCISIFQGYIHLRDAQPLVNPFWNYIVLGASLLLEGTSFVIALREFDKTRGEEAWWPAIKRSKDPSKFVVLFEDGAAVLGVLIVLICQYLNERFHLHRLDGIASMLVGMLLLIVSLLLARESKSLLMGEGISSATKKDIIAIMEKDEAIACVASIFSIYQAPDEVTVLLFPVFKKDLTTEQITAAIRRLRNAIKKKYELIKHVIVQPET